MQYNLHLFSHLLYAPFYFLSFQSSRTVSVLLFQTTSFFFFFFSNQDLQQFEIKRIFTCLTLGSYRENVKSQRLQGVIKIQQTHEAEAVCVDNTKQQHRALQPGMEDSAVSAYCLCMSNRVRHQLVSALTNTMKALRGGAAAEIHIYIYTQFVFFFLQRGLKKD